MTSLPKAQAAIQRQPGASGLHHAAHQPWIHARGMFGARADPVNPLDPDDIDLDRIDRPLAVIAQRRRRATGRGSP